jgi:hypothetical protein
VAFDKNLAKKIAAPLISNAAEAGLDDSFAHVVEFLSLNPEQLSWRGKIRPSLATEVGLRTLADKYFYGYRRSDFPAVPRTVPDEMVSIMLQKAYGYSPARTAIVKLDHQRAMVAESSVGNLLERYLDSKLRIGGWHWCCGSFVKAIDFVRLDNDATWDALQIKNRDNSENSSSSKIRVGTNIQKWFRTFSATGATNWPNLPPLMQGYGLSEDGFKNYVTGYLDAELACRQARTLLGVA